MKIHKKMIRSLSLITLLIGVYVTASVQITYGLTPNIDLNGNLKLQVVSSPISTNGTGGFAVIASSGNGSVSNPWIINNLEITGTGTENLISIANTNDYFIIEENTLIGGLNGILLNNADNGYILNNTIKSNYLAGISFVDSFNTRVESNEISDNGSGCGSRLSLSQIKLAGHAGGGVTYDPSGDSVVVGNHIFDNWVSGIVIEDAINITIQGNIIENNGNVCPLMSNSISLNQISHRDGYGIDIQDGSGNMISNNEISNNAQWGIITEVNSVDNSIRDNNLKNNVFNPQASDNGTRNIYDGNYWDDLSGIKYDLAGLMNNSDLHPRGAENTIYFDQHDFFPNRTVIIETEGEGTPIWIWFVIYLFAASIVLLLIYISRNET